MGILATSESHAIISEHPQDPDSVCVVERQDLVVHQIGGGKGCFFPVHIGKAHVAVGVNTRLLIDVANALDGAHVAGVLSHKKAGMGAFYFATGFFLFLGRFQSLDLGFGKNLGVFSCSFLQTLETQSLNRKIVALPEASDATGADLNASLLQLVSRPVLAVGGKL